MIRPTFRNSRGILALVALFAWMSLLAAPSLAITDEEIFRAFPFNLQNPGARAMGIGGAFISLADDSTAAQANPAGLTQLRTAELFAELRATGRDSVESILDVDFASPSFSGNIQAGAVSEPSDQVHPSFLSYVLPRKHVAFGFSRLESLRVRSRTQNSFTVVGERAIFDVDTEGRPVIVGTQPVDEERTAEADVSATIAQYNAGLAVNLHRTFSVGVTAVVGVLSIDGRVDNLVRDRADPFLSGLTLMDYATRIDDDDIDLAANVGLLWRPADSFRVGAVYRQGHRFVVEQRVADTGVSKINVEKQFGGSFENVIHTPDSYGLGVSWRPTEPLTFFLDAVHIEYSDLLDGYQAGLNRITYPDDETEFTVDDGTEVHLGIEYLIVKGSTPFALRAGAWQEADNRIRAVEPGLDVVFPGGEDLTHYTAGFGVTLQQSIQIDLAADVSSESTSIVASTIYRF